MKILLFGKNGQVGWELVRSLAPLGELTAPDRRDTGAVRGDLSDLDGLARTIRDVAPDVVVNAAAYTAVDRAESEPVLSHAVNALAPAVMAAEAKRLGAWLVHYSTDYVFDGSGERPWVETDPVAPLGVYGRTKAEGERHIAESGVRHLIFRTSWVYAARGGNFLNTILRLARERERLTVVDDQFGAPTGAALIADVTAHALRAAVARAELGGLYHLVANGTTHWHGYACRALELARASGAQFKATVEPVPSSAYPTAAARPHNSRLSNKKLEDAFGLRLPPWEDGVAHVLASAGSTLRLQP
jgi:dTDP-4-dehydrorhamnose reductase